MATWPEGDNYMGAAAAANTMLKMMFIRFAYQLRHRGCASILAHTLMTVRAPKQLHTTYSRLPGLHLWLDGAEGDILVLRARKMGAKWAVSSIHIIIRHSAARNSRQMDSKRLQRRSCCRVHM